MTAGKATNLPGIACIASTTVAVEGPLLQRASRVVSVPITNTFIPLNVTLTPELPAGFTGFWTVQNRTFDYFGDQIPTGNGTTSNDICSTTATAFNAVTQNFTKGPPLIGFSSGCPGSCRAKVRAPALSISSVKSDRIPVIYGRYEVPFGQKDYAFLSSTNLLLNEGVESINFVIAFSRVTDCTRWDS